MLVVDVTQRADCGELQQFLTDKYAQCQGDICYSSPQLFIFQGERQDVVTSLNMRLMSPATLDTSHGWFWWLRIGCLFALDYQEHCPTLRRTTLQPCGPARISTEPIYLLL